MHHGYYEPFLNVDWHDSIDAACALFLWSLAWSGLVGASVLTVAVWRDLFPKKRKR